MHHAIRASPPDFINSPLAVKSRFDLKTKTKHLLVTENNVLVSYQVSGG